MEFAILMDMNMNENSIYANMVSGRDPPPLCVPVPTGPLPLGFDMCIKMFNIFTPGYNLHMCMDIMARVQSSPIIVRKSFDFRIKILKFPSDSSFRLHEIRTRLDRVFEARRKRWIDWG